MKLLDLYCGGGGAGMGYHRAGFHVTGVDIDPQPDYPFDFVQADALAYVRDHGHEYDIIHASPPCQANTPVSRMAGARAQATHRDMIIPTRAELCLTGKPYVIENVPTAELIDPIILCGRMFDLNVYRHRAFETTMPVALVTHPEHTLYASPNSYLPTPERPVMTIVGRNGHHSRAWRVAAAHTMGVPWITSLNGVCEAIPPAYTHFIGYQLRKLLIEPGAVRV